MELDLLLIIQLRLQRDNFIQFVFSMVKEPEAMSYLLISLRRVEQAHRMEPDFIIHIFHLLLYLCLPVFQSILGRI